MIGIQTKHEVDIFRSGARFARGGAWESTVARTDNTTRRMHEPVGILEIEVLAIGDGSHEPTPGIESRERREDNVAPSGVRRNKASVSKPPPPLPPKKENRSEAPEGGKEDRGDQWIRNQGA